MSKKSGVGVKGYMRGNTVIQKSAHKFSFNINSLILLEHKKVL